MDNDLTPEATRLGDVSAVPVVLSDGRAWGFARPSVRISPKVEVDRDEFGRPVERVIVQTSFGYPPEIAALIGRVERACQSGDVVGQYASFFELAASVLRRVHDIDLQTACELLDVPDEDLPRLVGAVMAVVTGGKPSEGPVNPEGPCR